MMSEQLESDANGTRQFAGWFYLLLLVGAMIAVQVYPLTGRDAPQQPSNANELRVALSPHVERQTDFVSPETLTSEEPLSLVEATDTDIQVDLARSNASPASAARPAQPSTWSLADGQEVLALQFDLATQEDLRAGLEVRKPMRVNGAAVGEVAIAINGNSRLYISATDLRRVLPQELGRRLVADTDFVAFDDVRESGIAIRYDPVADALNVTT